MLKNLTPASSLGTQESAAVTRPVLWKGQSGQTRRPDRPSAFGFYTKEGYTWPAELITPRWRNTPAEVNSTNHLIPTPFHYCPDLRQQKFYFAARIYCISWTNLRCAWFGY